MLSTTSANEHLYCRNPGLSTCGLDYYRESVGDIALKMSSSAAAWLRYGAFRFLVGSERAVDRVAIVTTPIITAKLNDVA